MALNDFFKAQKKDVAVDGELVIDGSGSGTGGVEIHEIFTSSGADVYKEVDTTGDGNFDISVLIESQNSSFHSQGNQIEISENENVRIRLVNNSSVSVDFAVNGIEVSD